MGKDYYFIIVFYIKNSTLFSRRIASFVINVCRYLNLGALSGVAVFSVELSIFCCISPICFAVDDVAEQSCGLVLHS